MAKHTFKENVLRLIAVIGLLAILLLGAWGIIQLAFFISSLFSNAGGAASTVTEQAPAHETLTISLPATASNGSPITVSWGHQGGSGNYAYAVSYSCADGLTMKVPVPTGATQSVPCNTPFNYTQATSNLALTPTYTGETDAKVTITVTATKLDTGAVTATANGSLTVLAAKKAVATPAKTSSTNSSPKTSYYSSGRTTGLYGYPDLAVRILSASSQSGNATVQFEISNVGTNITPTNWSFSALLPINGSYTYPSGPQRALYPGDRIVYTLNFSDGGLGTGYTYGTCNQYGPCAIPGYSGGYQPTYNPYTTNSYYGSNYYGYQPALPYNAYGNYYVGAPKNVTIMIDQFNQVLELSKANNSATATYYSN